MIRVESRGANMQGVRAEWCYNLALSACGRAGRAVEAVRVFDGMMAAGLRPGLAAYTALLSLYCRAGALPEAARVLDGMEAAGLQPNTIVFSSLINGCEKAGNLQEALHYFDEMLVRAPASCMRGCLRRFPGRAPGAAWPPPGRRVALISRRAAACSLLVVRASHSNRQV